MNRNIGRRVEDLVQIHDTIFNGSIGVMWNIEKIIYAV
jgi:hypothetical protein